MKKSIVDFVLKEPEIDEDERFLDEDDETPMTIELAGKKEIWGNGRSDGYPHFLI